MLSHILRIAGALCAVLLLSGANSSRADDEVEPRRLEFKPAGSARRDGSSSGGKLVPFPEDALDAKKPARPLAPKSNFQPRFKSPNVRQVEHTEPLSADRAGEAIERHGEVVDSTDKAEPNAPAGDAALSPGRKLIDEAFVKSKVASQDTDYTAVIDLCRRGIGEGLSRTFEDYSRRLMSWAYNRRGEAHVLAGREKEALADFEAAVESNRDSWRSVHNRGVSYAAQGRRAEAMADFNRTLQLNKGYANAYFNRAELRCQQGDFRGAVSDYNAALQAGPADATTLNGRGLAFYRAERFGEALRDFGDALKLDPGHALALLNRGDVYGDLGRYGEAARDYRDAVRVDSKLARAYQSAAWLMATCPDEHYRNDKLAVEAAEKAVKLDPENYRCLETLAAAQANAGQFSEAKQTQDKAIAKAAEADRVAAEKRLSLYQRELAYRELPRQSFAAPEEHPVRQASATSPIRPKGRSNPHNRN